MDFVVSLRVLACEGVREPGAMPSVKFSVAWEARDLRGAGEADRMRGGVFQAAPRRWDGAHFGAFAEAVSGSVEELARMLNEVFGER